MNDASSHQQLPILGNERKAAGPCSRTREGLELIGGCFRVVVAEALKAADKSQPVPIIPFTIGTVIL